MSRSRQIVSLLFVGCIVGLWGCAKGTDGSNVSSDKIKQVETKLARLEDDFRAAASARDQLQKKLAAAAEAQALMQAELNKLSKDVKDKDDQIQKRTAERDLLETNYTNFRKGLKELIAKAEEGTSGSPTLPVIPTSNKKPEVPTLPTMPEVPMPPK